MKVIDLSGKNGNDLMSARALGKAMIHARALQTLTTNKYGRVTFVSLCFASCVTFVSHVRPSPPTSTDVLHLCHCDVPTVLRLCHCVVHTVLRLCHCVVHTVLRLCHCVVLTVLGLCHCDVLTVLRLCHCVGPTVLRLCHCDVLTVLRLIYLVGVTLIHWPQKVRLGVFSE
jgi:hypothetical protein